MGSRLVVEATVAGSIATPQITDGDLVTSSNEGEVPPPMVWPRSPKIRPTGRELSKVGPGLSNLGRVRPIVA